MRDARITGEWLENTKGYTVTLSPDGSGTSKFNKGGEGCQFSWSTKQESLLIEKVQGEAMPWPVKADTYDFTYEAMGTPGAVALRVSKSVPSGVGVTPSSEQPGLWEFERR